jgi:zinc transport system substrate-binding protein
VCAVFGSGSRNRAVPNGKPDVVATNFPAYDFARQVAGDRVNLFMLLPPGAESHSFDPTPQDIITIQNSELFVYTGGESDTWVDRILGSMDASKMRIVRMMDAVEVVEEEIVEGMQDDEHGHGEFDPANVQDRPMSDFAGSWVSGVRFLNNGSLDRYLRHRAEEEESSAEALKAEMLSAWASGYESLSVEGEALGIGGRTAAYAYQGYEITESAHGASVWYKYQIRAPEDGFPAYLMFNDHEHGGGEEHHEEEEGAAHLHLKYGSGGFAEMLEQAAWSPLYFSADASGEAVAEALSGHNHEEEPDYDEHVWTSPKNAQLIVRAITEALCAVSPGDAALFRRNAAAYNARLDELDKAFQAVVDKAARKTLVFGDRFPFRYFADAYGLAYFAAFPGCSTETEASAATIAFLINKIRAEHIPAVFHIELSNEKIADVIAEETGAKKLLFSAAHNISKRDFDNGATFLEIQQANVARLKEALQ